MSELETAKDLLKISVWPALICALKSALMPASFGTILKSVRYIAIDLLVLLLILASHIFAFRTCLHGFWSLLQLVSVLHLRR